MNHQILYNLQDVFNLLPGLQVQDSQQAFITQTNDTMLVMYISSVVRAISALHNLIVNKIDLRAEETKEFSKLKQQGKKPEKTEDEKKPADEKATPAEEKKK